MLKQMLGNQADFRPGQWEAIESIARYKRRVLVVQRTGWGKSLVYFLATKLLRDRDSGPTLLISPLLSLMRNQIDMAEKIGIQAFTINSSNQEEWDVAESALFENQCDILLISPERLNNERFIKTILPEISGRIGFFVVDEAHCISDWGHDFRPDYRRIVRILRILPRGMPVLGTTATANQRVIDDIQHQLGEDLIVLRGPLDRETLRLQAIRLSRQSERLAWLVENLPRFQGSGIIYCLTVQDTERVAGWLKTNGFNAEAYHAGDDKYIDRPALEQAFIGNKIQILVATVALGMGFDKPDISFVIHFQRPGSVIAYYQQVGRAGRAVNVAYGILLSGSEDNDIQDYFINSAFPDPRLMEEILSTLENVEALSLPEITTRVNISQKMAEKALKLLEADGAIGTSFDSGRHYFRTINPWKPDTNRINQVTELRREEQHQMQVYLDYSGCLMEFLLQALDDPNPKPCGRCANCQGTGFPTVVSQDLVHRAETFIKGDTILIKPRKRLPVGILLERGRRIPEDEQNLPGRSLSYYGDSGWGILVKNGKYIHNHFSNDLLDACYQLIRERWNPDPFPQWLTIIPSIRHPELVLDFARRLASELGILFFPVLVRYGNPAEQNKMQNSTMQARNVLGSLTLSGAVPAQPVLLVDDIIDSGWTLTIAGMLLRENGSGPVYPFTLANASGKSRTL